MWTKKLEEEKEKLARSSRRIAEAEALKDRKEQGTILEASTTITTGNERAAKVSAPSNVTYRTSGKPAAAAARSAREEVPDSPEVVEVMIVGDSGVGKTSFAVRFADDDFAGDRMTTVGIDFMAKTTVVNGKR